MILGTAGYMSPEQARGGAVDKRTDIWAFGVVLYELLSGRRLFHGDTISDTLAAVLKSEPDWSALPANTPPWVKRLLARCLERDKKNRLRDIGDAFLEESSQPSPTSSLPRWILPAAAAAVAVAAIAGWLLRSPKPIDPPHRSFAIPVEGLSTIDYAHRAVISPDGKYIAYVAQDKLWLRDLASEQARPLEGTENAEGPFWSPDSAEVAFAAGNVIKKTSATGGVPFVLTNIANSYRGGAWSPDGRSLVISTQLGGLYEVSASGGVAKPALPPDPAGTTYFPQFLPTGTKERILLASQGNRYQHQNLQLIDLDKGTRQLLRAGAYPIYTSTGDILFQASLRAEGVWVLPFSIESRKPTREATPLLNVGTGLSVSRDGTLVWVDASDAFSKKQLVYRDRTGKKLRILSPPQSRVSSLAFSPDGSRAAYASSEDGNDDIWIVETATGARTRFTFATEDESNPCWTPSGKEIIFTSTKAGQRRLLIQPVDRSRDPKPMLSGPYTPDDWSPDGSILVLTHVAPNSRPAVWAMRRKPDGSFDPPFAFSTSKSFMEDQARFSPDGRFVIYHSNESGTDGVFLRAFPDGTGKRPISLRAGETARWSRESREIFYQEDGRLMSLPAQTNGSVVTIGAAVELFRSSAKAVESRSSFDVTADGQRFLIAEPVEDEKAKPPAIHVIENWPALLRQKLTP